MKPDNDKYSKKIKSNFLPQFILIALNNNK